MKSFKNSKAVLIAQGGLIAALCVVLTCFINAFSLASGAIQVRISEALTILPLFTPAAVPGLFVGCIVSNLITGCAPLDIVFGSIATLLGAVGTRLLRKRNHFLAPIPPIISNTLIVPFILSYVYGYPGSIYYFMLTVGIGEILSAGVLGLLLYPIIKHNQKYLFAAPESGISRN